MRSRSRQLLQQSIQARLTVPLTIRESLSDYIKRAGGLTLNATVEQELTDFFNGGGPTNSHTGNYRSSEQELYGVQLFN